MRHEENWSYLDDDRVNISGNSSDQARRSDQSRRDPVSSHIDYGSDLCERGLVMAIGDEVSLTAVNAKTKALFGVEVVFLSQVSYCTPEPGVPALVRSANGDSPNEERD
jgi:hypothetical protein